MILLDLDPLTASHIALALDNHRGWCRSNLRPYPPELSELVLMLTEAARSGQERPTSADAVDSAAGDGHGRKTKLLLTVEEVAEVLNVGVRTVRRLTDAGDLPSITVGRSRRIHADDLNDYLDDLRADPGATA